MVIKKNIRYKDTARYLVILKSLHYHIESYHLNIIIIVLN